MYLLFKLTVITSCLFLTYYLKIFPFHFLKLNSSIISPG